jgi:hypothetical protein
MRRGHAESRLQRGDERLEEIEHQRVRPPDDGAELGVDERREYDWPAVVAHGLALDLVEALLGAGDAVDKRQRHLDELHPLELRKEAVAEHLGGNPGAVRYEKHGASLSHDRKEGGR